MITSFRKSRTGQFSIMLALALPVLLSAVALAVDVSTLVTARSKLQNALDAAVLAASRLNDNTISRHDVFDNFLATNLATDEEFTNIDGNLVVENGLKGIATTGTVEADVKLNFAHYLGATRHVRVNAAAYEPANSIEVAMVLDNTGSMGTANMDALRDAAEKLVEMLQQTASPERVVKAALVPFVTAVNVKGEGFSQSWIDTHAKAPYHGENFAKNGPASYSHLDLFKALKVEWKGCVEARPAPDNLDDTPPDPTRPASLFVPYFAPDNPGGAEISPNSADLWNNSYLTDKFDRKNDKPKTASPGQQKSVDRYLDPTTPRFIAEKGPRTTGPNYACPTPIVPLTADFTKLKNEIKKMIHWEGSGTNAAEGLSWGMRVLSPTEPYTQGAPFDDKSVSKVMVIFTDGANTVFGAKNSTLAVNHVDLIPFNKSDYGAYNFIDSGRTGTTNRNTSLANINTWTQTMCTRLKQKNVRVFTILFKTPDLGIRDLYAKCASAPADFFPTNDVEALKAAFQKIGAAVTTLALTQ